MTCSICLEELNNNSRKLKCSHTFHKECIDNWFKHISERCCPLCRQIHSNKFDIKYEKLTKNNICIGMTDKGHRCTYKISHNKFNDSVCIHVPYCKIHAKKTKDTSFNPKKVYVFPKYLQNSLTAFPEDTNQIGELRYYKGILYKWTSKWEVIYTNL